MTILITGISASGKSTVAQLVAERLPRSAHVRGDVFRRMVINGRAEMTPDPSEEALRQLRLRYRLAATTANLYAEAGFTPIIQDVVLGPDLLIFREMIRTLRVVVLAPDVPTVERRERERPKTGYGDYTVADLDAILRNETPRIGLWLDSSTQTPERTADEILERLPEARV